MKKKASKQKMVYAEMVSSKVHGSQAKWFRMADSIEGLDTAKTHGPYRDSTDAENAAEDLAKIRDAFIQWVG